MIIPDLLRYTSKCATCITTVLFTHFCKHLFSNLHNLLIWDSKPCDLVYFSRYTSVLWSHDTDDQLVTLLHNF